MAHRSRYASDDDDDDGEDNEDRYEDEENEEEEMDEDGDDDGGDDEDEEDMYDAPAKPAPGIAAIQKEVTKSVGSFLKDLGTALSSLAPGSGDGTAASTALATAASGGSTSTVKPDTTADVTFEATFKDAHVKGSDKNMVSFSIPKGTLEVAYADPAVASDVADGKTVTMIHNLKLALQVSRPRTLQFTVKSGSTVLAQKKIQVDKKATLRMTLFEAPEPLTEAKRAMIKKYGPAVAARSLGANVKVVEGIAAFIPIDDELAGIYKSKIFTDSKTGKPLAFKEKLDKKEEVSHLETDDEEYLKLLPKLNQFFNQQMSFHDLRATSIEVRLLSGKDLEGRDLPVSWTNGKGECAIKGTITAGLITCPLKAAKK